MKKIRIYKMTLTNKNIKNKMKSTRRILWMKIEMNRQD